MRREPGPRFDHAVPSPMASPTIVVACVIVTTIGTTTRTWSLVVVLLAWSTHTDTQRARSFPLLSLTLMSTPVLDE